MTSTVQGVWNKLSGSDTAMVVDNITDNVSIPRVSGVQRLSEGAGCSTAPATWKQRRGIHLGARNGTVMLIASS